MQRLLTISLICLYLGLTVQVLVVRLGHEMGHAMEQLASGLASHHHSHDDHHHGDHHHSDYVEYVLALDAEDGSLPDGDVPQKTSDKRVDVHETRPGMYAFLLALKSHEAGLRDERLPAFYPLPDLTPPPDMNVG
ncbi:MAG: hypothetical protein NWR72_01100 [Bacteroidia bacterium]|nr:hypothetical protein [Bacteroidia bacterium]